MDKIIEFLKSWDKIMHVLCSCLVMLVSTALANIWCIYWVALVIGTVVTALCAFGKEGYDKIAGKVASWKDIIADAVGYGCALIPLLIIGFSLVAI